VGSPDYMAPEILENNGYDYLVDYWSLGCILFEFLSGKLHKYTLIFYLSVYYI